MYYSISNISFKVSRYYDELTQFVNRISITSSKTDRNL